MREEPALTQAAVAPKPILDLDWQTDLTQVETDREKLRAAQARALEEPAAAPPRKRERRPPSSVSDEPLIQVETVRRAPATESAHGSGAVKEDALTGAAAG